MTQIVDCSQGYTTNTGVTAIFTVTPGPANAGSILTDFANDQEHSWRIEDATHFEQIRGRFAAPDQIVFLELTKSSTGARIDWGAGVKLISAVASADDLSNADNQRDGDVNKVLTAAMANKVNQLPAVLSSFVSTLLLTPQNFDDLYTNLQISRLYLAGLANGGKIGIFDTGQSNQLSALPECVPTTPYITNPKVRVWANSARNYPQTGPWGWEVADTSINYGCPSAIAGDAFVGIVGTFISGGTPYRVTQRGLEMADYIQRATGFEVYLFACGRSGTEIAQWINKSGATPTGYCNIPIYAQAPAALAAAGLSYFHIMSWDQGWNDKVNGRTYAQYVTDGNTLRADFEARGWINHKNTMWVIHESPVVSSALAFQPIGFYWAGEEAFYKSIANAVWISARDYDTSASTAGIHFTGDQNRIRGRHAGAAVLRGPSAHAPSMREMKEMSWIQGAESDVQDPDDWAPTYYNESLVGFHHRLKNALRKLAVTGAAAMRWTADWVSSDGVTRVGWNADGHAMHRAVFGAIYARANNTVEAGYSASLVNVLAAFNTNGFAQDVTADHTANALTTSVPGFYRIQFTASYRVGNAGSQDKKILWAIWQQGAASSNLVAETRAPGGTFDIPAQGTVNIVGYVANQFGVNLPYEIRYSVESGLTSLTINEAQFLIERIG